MPPIRPQSHPPRSPASPATANPNARTYATLTQSAFAYPLPHATAPSTTTPRPATSSKALSSPPTARPAHKSAPRKDSAFASQHQIVLAAPLRATGPLLISLMHPPMIPCFSSGTIPPSRARDLVKGAMVMVHIRIMSPPARISAMSMGTAVVMSGPGKRLESLTFQPSCYILWLQTPGGTDEGKKEAGWWN